jgi:hypothetical protein
MGKRTKLREAEKYAAEQALAARLRNYPKRNSGPGFITTYDQFPPEFHARIEPYLRNAIRNPGSWRSALRVRSPELRFLELVRFTFAKFSVPPFLEEAWLPANADEGHRPDFRDWYMAAAQGRSLYREHAADFLTRAETHQFLAAPGKIGSARAALWFAIARAEAGDTSVALQIARTRLAGRYPGDAFMRDVARYLARNRTTVEEMDELIEFLDAARNADADFTLAGRTLAALRRRRQDWLRLREAGSTAARMRWTGSALADAVYDHEGTMWRISQIRTAIRLLEEGERMHHCVFTYLGECTGGFSSIWSVTSEKRGARRRHLTIELGSNGAVLQCRGVANRPPTNAEREVVRRWADERQLEWQDYAEPLENA